MNRLRPLKESDFDRLKPYFRHQTYRLCAYSLASILVWRSAHYHPVGTEKGGALVVGAEFADKTSHRHLLLPIQPDGHVAPEPLHRLAASLDFGSYWYVPEAYINHFGRNRIDAYFRIETQPHLDDYVYRTQDLAGLTGKRYSQKRNLINHFRREYVLRGRVQVAPIEAAVVPETLAFLEEWCLERGCEEDQNFDLACEKQAAINALTALSALDMAGVLIRVDGIVSAFAVGSRLTDEMGVLHFEKAASAIKGLYQYLDRTCARQLFGGYAYINKESDMGLPGLQKAKQSYHPVMKERSFALVLR
jgi:hypothetical protein